MLQRGNAYHMGSHAGAWEPGKTYYYKSEDIDTNGANTLHTESVTLRGTTAAPEASPDSDAGGGGCFIDSVTHDN